MVATCISRNTLQQVARDNFGILQTLEICLIVKCLLTFPRSRLASLVVVNVVTPLDNSLVTNTFFSGIRLCFFLLFHR